MPAISTPDVCRQAGPPLLDRAAPAPASRAWWRGESEAQRQQRFESEALPHMRALFGTAYRLTGNAHDAEDLVQDTFLRAYRAFHTFTPGTHIRAWLFTILHRARTDRFRRAGRVPPTVDVDDCVLAVAAPQDALARGGERLERALRELPEAFRAAVVLRDVQELSYDEIARALDVPVGTVMSRIHRGRALLRRALADLRPGACAASQAS
jgi:RNA polymerase sigma-70 factor (ECF subfamily)